MCGVVLGLGTCVLCVALCNVGYLSTRVCVVASKVCVCVCVCVLLLVKACVCVLNKAKKFLTK